jgi:hypothetical protein
MLNYLIRGNNIINRKKVYIKIAIIKIHNHIGNIVLDFLPKPNSLYEPSGLYIKSGFILYIKTTQTTRSNDERVKIFFFIYSVILIYIYIK